jgi:hypothetical protein
VSTITEPSGTLGLNEGLRLSSEPVGDGVGGAPKSEEKKELPPVGASGEGGCLARVRARVRVTVSLYG